MHADENDKDGISEILTSLQNYQTFVGDDELRVYNEQGVVGDQLSVERGTNAQFHLANGFTPQERLENMHFEIADFHSEMKFMQVRVYSICKCLLNHGLKNDNPYTRKFSRPISLSRAKFSHNFWGYSPNLESVVTVFGCVMANLQICKGVFHIVSLWIF